MRVLVTGATAPSGEALIRALLADRAIEHVLAVGLDAQPVLLPASPRLTYRACDLTRPRAAHDLLFGQGLALGIDAIVHGALHRRASDHGARVHAQNVETTRELLTASARHPTVRRFVFVGTAEVYALRAAEPTLLDEDAALEFDPGAPQWIRDRVEADLTVCAQLTASALRPIVLRCAEVIAPGAGSQLWDYLQSRVCLRPLGFDPMINVLSREDQVRAIQRALASPHVGVCNIAGAETWPLSAIVARWGRVGLPVPGPMLAPLYRLRSWTVGFEFRYDRNARRFHFGGVVDGRRAEDALGYRPTTPIAWPVASHGARLA
ncbi:MAG: NAD-dependent epimerase/dehydratase family protein [Deltaproteobacteria bacterium]|nr:NAD-dependent epimerase/dehydratase family protein [Deltaproteobacteria bacterium]